MRRGANIGKQAHTQAYIAAAAKYCYNNVADAGMAELADAQDLGSCAARCAGSSPVARTITKRSFTIKRAFRLLMMFF